MGSVYRRSYKDKRTGKVRRVRTYTLKYRDASGRWATEATDTPSKSVALRLLAERELAAGVRPLDGMEVDAGGPTLLDLTDRFLASAALRLKPSTLAMYAERLGFTLPRLDAERPADLDVGKIDDYLRRRLGDGRAPRTLNIELSVLRRMLAWAAEHGLIASNPLARLKPIRDPRTHRRRALSPDEVKRLLAAAPPWRRIFWATLAATGMRRGEAIHLRVTDFDPERGVIRLRPEITKTARGRRCPLPTGLSRLLVEYVEAEKRNRPPRQQAYLRAVRADLARLEAEGRGDAAEGEGKRRLERLIADAMGHDFLFANGRGLPLRRNLRRAFLTDLGNSGIDPAGLCIHSLRYTANSAMLAAGLNETVIRARMGHCSARMTERYHDPDYDDGAGTGAVAELIGVDDGPRSGGADRHPPDDRPASPGLSLGSDEALRPPPEVLAALVERYSNVLIGRVLEMSPAGVGKLLRRHGIGRTRRVQTKLPDWQVALLRAELRAALPRQAETPGPPG